MVLAGAPPARVVAWAQQSLSQPLLEISPIGGGLTRTKWLLHIADSVQEGRLVVRWCDPREWGETGREHVRHETLACRLLAGSGLPVPRLIAADLDGVLAGGPANLVTWLPGAVRLDPLGPAAIEALAVLAVSVHRQPVADEQRPPVFSYRGPAEPVVPDWTTRPGLWQRAIDLRAAGAPSTPFGLLHRDFHLGNILWQGDTVSGLVDWAETSWGPADLDVAHLCSDFAMLHTTAGADAFRQAYLRHGGRLVADEFRYWQVSDILGFLPDPAHILPAVLPARPDLSARRIRDGLEDLLALTLGWRGGRCGYHEPVLAISRFRVPGDPSGFRMQAAAVVQQFASSRGSEGAELVQNLDDPELWAIVSRWADVGSYRRAFNGTAAKMVLVPLLSLAIDEPSAYAMPSDVGENRPRGTLG